MAASTSLKVKRVEAARGLDWLRDGFRLFRKSPLLWIVLIVVWVLISILLTAVPYLGALVASLLYPVFFAGLMVGCRALERGENMEIGHLFAGFKQNAAQLVSVGGVNLVAQILIYVLMRSAAGESLSALQADTGTAPDPAAMAAALRGLLPALLVGLALSVPLMMALWFAPPLVVFHEVGVWDAIKLSFRACLENTMPFLLYGAVGLGLMMLTPFTLGLLLIALIPTFVASVYTGYRDVFV
jgi:uncharacterized membrane protein